MSKELHIGKLVPVNKIANHQEFMDFVHKNKLIPHGEDCIESFLGEQLIGDIKCYPYSIIFSDQQFGKYKYCYFDGVIYEFASHEEFNCDYLDKWDKNADGSINFYTLFNNKQLSFNQVFEDAIKTMNIDL